MSTSLKVFYCFLVVMILNQLLGIETIFGTAPGILPQFPFGWLGILTSPFYHASWSHLFSNLFPLIFLGWLGQTVTGRNFWIVFIGFWVLGGMGVYFWGRPVWHIGASGWVYGWISFLFFRGIVLRNKRAFLISLSIAMLYGGAIAGIFPGVVSVSWESHLFSGLAGLGMAFYKWNQKQDQAEQAPDDASESFEEVSLESPVLPLKDWDEEEV